MDRVIPIQEMMARLGYRTKDQLAQDLGCTHGLVSQWSSGKSKPSFDMARKLLQLGATVDELFGIPCPCSKAEAAQKDPSMADVLNRLSALEKIVTTHDMGKENPDFQKLTRGAQGDASGRERD